MTIVRRIVLGYVTLIIFGVTLLGVGLGAVFYLRAGFHDYTENTTARLNAAHEFVEGESRMGALCPLGGRCPGAAHRLRNLRQHDLCVDRCLAGRSEGAGNGRGDSRSARFHPRPVEPVPPSLRRRDHRRCHERAAGLGERRQRRCSPSPGDQRRGNHLSRTGSGPRRREA